MPSPDLDARATRAGTWLLAILGPLGALALYLSTLTIPGSRLDLRVYRDATAAWIAGQPLYDLRVTEESLPFTYPPFSAALLTPLHLPPFLLSAAAWAALSATCLYLVVGWAYRAVPGNPVPRLTAAATAGVLLLANPVRQTFDLGQVNLVLLALVCADLVRPAPARTRGILTGVAAAIKIAPLFLLAYPLLERDWRTLARAAASFALIAALGLLVLRQETLTYLTVIWDPGRIGDPAYGANQSLAGLLHRTGAYTTATWVALCAAAGVLGAYAAWRYRHQSRIVPLLVIAITGLLVSPISWDHHWAWICLAPAATLALWRTEANRLAARATAALTVTLALWIPVQLTNRIDRIPVDDSIYVLAALAWLVCLALAPRTPRTTPLPATPAT